MAQTLTIYRELITEEEEILDVEVLDEPKLVIDDFTVSLTHMDVGSISARFYYPRKINFLFNEYVIYEHEGSLTKERFYLSSAPTWTKDEKSLMLEYTAIFLTKFEVIKHIPLIDSWENLSATDTAKKPTILQTEYSFFGGAYEYFLNIKSSMIAEFGYEDTESFGRQPKGWTLIYDLSTDYPQQGDDQVITVSNMTVFDGFTDIYEKFKIPFFMAGKTITVGGNKVIVSHKFRYGKDKGLYKLTRTNQNDTLITKIRGVGSEQNIPHDYLADLKESAGFGKIPMTRLMPKIYRDTLYDAAAYPSKKEFVRDYYTDPSYNPAFPRLSFETFDNIFPTIKEHTYSGERIDIINAVYFMASSVSEENKMIPNGENQDVAYPRFWVRLPALGFNLNDCLNAKDPLILSPTSGLCGGCKFKVLSIGHRPNKWHGWDENGTYSDYDGAKFDGFSLDRAAVTTIPQTETKTTVNFYVDVGDVISVNVPITMGIDVKNSGGALTTAYFLARLIHVDGIVDNVTIASESISVGSGNQFFNDEIPFSKTIHAGESGDYKIEIQLTVNMPSGTTGSVKSECGSFMAVIERGEFREVASDTTEEQVWVLLEKDLESYNTLMPYPISPMWLEFEKPEDFRFDADGFKAPTGLVPQAGDSYILTGITLPYNYITEAEYKLEVALKDILSKNNKFKSDYQCGFDEKFIFTNPQIASQIKVGNVVQIYDEPNPSATVSPAALIDVTINSLTLKYSPDKTISTAE